MGIVINTFPPVYDKNSKLLIVGTMPSVISRQQGFYYGNPKNRFYAVISALLNKELPVTVPQKKDMLLDAGIALYDVLKTCDIHGSGDCSIKDAQPNDFTQIFNGADIKRVYANGRAAQRYFERFVGAAVYLPSTSPANASYNIETLIASWRIILKEL